MRGMYNTFQKQYLYNLIQQQRDKQFTADELISLIPENALSRSTAYRILKNFVKDGIVKRYTEENSRRYIYQFVEDKSCDFHFHLKCVGCGKVIHLKEKISDDVSSEIMSEYNFRIDESKTVIFGKCESCNV